MSCKKRSAHIVKNLYLLIYNILIVKFCHIILRGPPVKVKQCPAMGLIWLMIKMITSLNIRRFELMQRTRKFVSLCKFIMLYVI